MNKILLFFAVVSCFHMSLGHVNGEEQKLVPVRHLHKPEQQHQVIIPVPMYPPVQQYPIQQHPPIQQYPIQQHPPIQHYPVQYPQYIPQHPQIHHHPPVFHQQPVIYPQYIPQYNHGIPC